MEFVRLTQISGSAFHVFRGRRANKTELVVASPAGGPRVVDDVYNLESQLINFVFNNNKVKRGRSIGYTISNSELIAGQKIRAVQLYNIKW